MSWCEGSINSCELKERLIVTDYMQNNQILIFNNESIIFDFSDYILTNEYGHISPYKKNNIKIYYGDGDKDILISPLTNTTKKWDEIEHIFNFDEDDNIEEEKEIIIEIKNIENLKKVIKIPYKVVISEDISNGLELDLLDINLTNDNKMVFIFQNNIDKQIILANEIENS